MALSRNSYYRGADWLMQFGVLTLLIVAPFEGRGRALYQIGQGMALLGMVGRCGMDLSWRYLWRVLAVYVALLGVFLATPYIRSILQSDPDLFAGAARAFFKEYAAILFGTVILLCYTDSATYKRLREHPRILAIVGAMALVWLWVVLASTVSLDQKESLRTVRKEFGAYILLFLMVIESTRTWTRLRRLMVVTFVVGAITCVASCAFYLLYLYADHYDMSGLELYLSDAKRLFAVRTHVGSVDIGVQAQYPFEHPNRLGSFGVIVTMLSLVALPLCRKNSTRAWVIAGGLVAFIAVFLSGTRGAMIAAVAGLTVFIVLWNWRFIFVVAIALVLGYALNPERVAKIRTEIAEMDLSQGNMARRVYVALAAGEMMRDDPWFGIGYGEEIFEEAYPIYKEKVAARYDWKGLRKGLKQDDEQKSHAHNNYLQMGAACGIPAMVAYVLFLLFLGIGLLRRWAVPLKDPEWFRMMAAAMFALLVAISVYGLSNFSLRKGIGMYIWLILAASIAFIQLSAHPPAPQERPPK